MDLLSRTSRRSIIGLAALGLVAVATIGCAPDRIDTRPTAQCCVCKCNNDLGCLIVHIDDKTPRSTYQDQVYYFCSEDCKKAFDKAPQKYLKQ
jgi:YHS domain-containing protein